VKALRDKKQKIMEASVKLFSENGYHATSIQQIADTLGIAKGSLYFYFNSKEDLLVYICKYYIDLFIKEFESVVADPSKHPRDRLAQQIILMSEQVSNNRDFITMFMNERFEVNEEIHQLFIMLKSKILLITQRCIIELYGEKVESFSYDAALIFSSISDGYLGLTVLHQINLDMNEVSNFLIERLDDIVKGLLTTNLKPIITTQLIEIDRRTINKSVVAFR
jgi:AcrR family transcriptional regulator